MPSGNPRFSARTVLSRRQAWILATLLLAGGVALAVDARLTLMIANVVVILLYLLFCSYKLVLQFISLHRSPQPFDPAALPPGGWPDYTILVPLYHEQAAVPGLMAHLRTLDYPPERLQILLLVEADDDDTQQAISQAGLTAPFEMVCVPVSQPRTKPKACNYGLSRATGAYLVIFDAEDRPELDQLKKAARRFADAEPGLICLQAQLN